VYTGSKSAALHGLSPRRRDGPHVLVRAERLLVGSVAVRDERDLLAVRREGDCAVFVLARRRVEVARRHVGRGARGDVEDEDVMAHVLPPLVPVPVEEARQVVDLDGVLFRLLTLLLVAGLVRAPGIHVRDERELLAVRREDERVLDAGREVRELARLAAREVEEPHLRRPRSRRDECEGLPVRREARRVVGLLVPRQGARRGRAVRGHEPDVRVPLAGGEVRRRPDERDPLPVRRQLRVAHADGGDDVFDRHRPGRKSGGRSEEENGGKEGTFHAASARKRPAVFTAGLVTRW